VLRGDPQPTSPAKYPAVALAGQARGGRVDDRHELLEVIHEDAIEKVLVPVVEPGEAGVALEGIALLRDARVGPLGLLLQRGDHVRQESLEPEGSPLLLRERRGAVVDRVAEQLGPPEPHLDSLPTVRSQLPSVRFHCYLRLCNPRLHALRRPLT